MFEQSVLDNNRQKRSKWSWMGLVVQAGVVTGLLLVPMISPEILSVMLPKALIYVPLKPAAPVEIEMQTTANSRPQTDPTVVTARRPVRRFEAPRFYDNPVNQIIDGPGFDPPAFAIGDGRVGAASTDGIPVAAGFSIALAAPPPKPVPPARTEAPKPLRVGGAVQEANIINRVLPAYPVLAKQARISGVVKLEGVIAKDGTVQNLRVLSGHPLLVGAALSAVKQWRYRPTMLNDVPVEVIAPIDVNFILSN
ncbi:MAG TPA: energy transducer TonB [Bryobacteraceae bacterium]|nr:energy transducer TonB [Bryobacteraceae bacterium]